MKYITTKWTLAKLYKTFKEGLLDLIHHFKEILFGQF